jgi:type II secretory pathway pseudopilin PulG
MPTMMARVQEIGSRRFELTYGKAWAIAAGLFAVALSVAGYIWTASGQWAVVNLRLDQTEQAARLAGQTAQDVKERLQTIATEAASDRRILLRLETKMDNITVIGRSARHPSASSGVPFPN